MNCKRDERETEERETEEREGGEREGQGGERNFERKFNIFASFKRIMRYKSDDDFLTFQMQTLIRHLTKLVDTAES